MSAVLLVAAFVLAQPTALWGLAALVPIALFHLYFRRRRRVLVPFTPLLLESMGPVRREARFKRLREAASLLARMLALVCAVLALGGLRPAEAEAPVADLFVVVDADITTAARESGGATRLAHAQELARAFVRSVPTRGAGQLSALVSVLVAGQAPRLLVPPTRDLADALKRLEPALVPAPAEADLGATVALALEGAARREAARVVVLTARAFEPPRTAIALDVLGTGTTRRDQRIVELGVDHAEDGGGYAVRLAAINDEESARTRRVVVRVDGEIVASEDLTLEAGDAREVQFEVPSPRQAAWLEVELEGDDAFPGNDAVEVRLAPVPKPSVLVVHSGRVRPYVMATLEALGAEGLIDKDRSGYVRASDVTKARPRDVTLVDGVGLPRDALRPGAYVFLAPLAGALPFELGEEVRKPLIWRTVPGHPLIDGLDFRRAFVVRGRALKGAGLEPLAYAEGRPIIAEGERGGARYVVLGLDPEGSMLPVQGALVLLVRNAILRLARAPVAPLKPFYRRGEALRPEVDLPGGADADLVWDGVRKDALLAGAGRGRARARIASDGVVWRVPAGAVGRVRVATGAGTAAAWSGWTSLVDLDPARTIAPARPAAEAPPAAAARADQATRWRTLLLALAVLFLLLDLALVARARSAAAQG